MEVEKRRRWRRGRDGEEEEVEKRWRWRRGGGGEEEEVDHPHLHLPLFFRDRWFETSI